MSLKELVAKRILEDILGAVGKKGGWRVLVLDHLATRIVSSCCKMHDVMDKGITLVEGLEKSRQPQPSREAVYIIWPSEESISRVLTDFDPRNRCYKLAHVFLLDCIPKSVLAKLQQSPAIRYIQCLTESYIGFIPNESKVFTLDYPDSFQVLYTPGTAGKGGMKERICNQLATLCAFLGEYPTIRCQQEIGAVVDIASSLHKRLEHFRKQDPNFAKGEKKSKSVLLILDRGFDIASPLLHELTYQAMVYDLLNIQKDVYRYQTATEGGETQTKSAILDENDEVWLELRHQHFVDVKKTVGQAVKKFAESHQKSSATSTANMSIEKLHSLIKKMPQHHRELSKFSRHLSLVEDCDKKLQSGLYELCKVEQDLVMGEDETGQKVKDTMTVITQILFSQKLGTQEKVRLLMLQLFCNQGMTREALMKVMERVEIPTQERQCILKLGFLGQPVLTDVKVEASVLGKARKKLTRKQRPEEKYVVSRWAPILQDIMEYTLEGNLDQGYCPVQSSHPDSSPSSPDPAPSSSSLQSVRSRHWDWVSAGKNKGPSSQHQRVEERGERVRLMVFVVGGVTYSEIRATYEVASQFPSHDILIGSTHIITPAEFISQLHTLELPYKEKN